MKLGHVRSPGEIDGLIWLDPFVQLSEYFISPLPRKHLHLVVETPDIRKCSPGFGFYVA